MQDEKQLDYKKLIEKLHELNSNGSGYRSIGEWKLLTDEQRETAIQIAESMLFQFEEKIKYINYVLTKEKAIIVMRETYSDNIRFHCIKSFAHWFLANIESAKVLDKFSESDIDLENICREIVGFQNIVSSEIKTEFNKISRKSYAREKSKLICSLNKCIKNNKK